MLRTPSAWAPSSSDSRAIRFRSRVVQWTRHSRSRSCWIPNATDRALIRTLAMAESDTLTTSTPASRRSRAASMVRSMRMLRGGSISTDTTNRPPASSPARRVGGGASSVGAGGVGRDASFDEGRPRRSVAAARPSGGVGSRGVERHPHRGDVIGRRPATAADDARTGRDEAGRHVPEIAGAGGVDEAALEALRQSGVRHDRTGRFAVGRQAHRLDRVETGRRARPAVDADRVGARRGSRRPRPRAGLLPSASASSSPNVSEAITGTSDERRASSTASTSCPRSENVSSTSRSMPPSSRLSICSRNAARADASAMTEPPCAGGPSGPTEPPTRASRPLTSRASRASRAACRLSCDDLSLQSPGGEPMAVGAERQRFDQLGAGLEILAMGSSDHLRMTRHELLETGSLGNATAEQERAHPAVDEHRAGGRSSPESLSGQAVGRGCGHRSPIGYTVVGDGPATERPFLLGRVPGSSLIVQENLPGIGTLPARRR